MKTKEEWLLSLQGHFPQIQTELDFIHAVQRDAWEAGAEAMRSEYTKDDPGDYLDLPPFPEQEDKL